MCSRFPKSLLFTLFLGACAAAQLTSEVRVCADPDNPPFSSTRQDGFENRIAELIAANLHARLTYVWQRMGRGFVREYLDKGRCDLLIGVPVSYRPVLTTSPYYRSSYVFVSRRDSGLELTSLDSSSLRNLKIGVQVLDENYTPPGEALARRGLQKALVGFDTTGRGAGSIVQAVADRQVDVAVVWGPLAGYFANSFHKTLKITPLEPEVDPPGLPFTFEIAMGVRKGNVTLRDQLDSILLNHQAEVRKILDGYDVPQLPLISNRTVASAGN